MTLLRILESNNMRVRRIDRRPSLELTPFLDVYFVEVEGYPEQVNGHAHTGRKPWDHVVHTMLRSALQAQLQVHLLGHW